MIKQVVPRTALEQVIEACGAQEERVRKLPTWLTMLLCNGMNPLTEESLDDVLLCLDSGTRWQAGAGVEVAARASSISAACYKMGGQAAGTAV